MKLLENATRNRWTTTVAAFLILQAVLGHVSSAYTQSQNCEVYPFALSLSTVSNATTGAILNNLPEGSGFVWLSWTSQRGKKALVDSLTPPGTSHLYQDPDDATDRVLNLRDWVKATSANNSKDVRQALDRLIGAEVVVPLWKQTRGSGDTLAYRVCKYARVRLLSHNLTRARLTMQFLGFASCESSNTAPNVDAGVALEVIQPNSVALLGQVTDDGLPTGQPITGQWSKASGPGAVTFANAAAFTTTASFSAAGEYVLRLTASDTELSSFDDVTITVKNANHAPVALAQNLATSEDTALPVNLLASDSDGDRLTWSISTPPRFGLLTGVLPNVTYIPALNFFGEDTFQFRVSDGELDSAADVSVSVSAVNDAPRAHPQDLTGNEDNPISIVLSGSDVEGTPLTFSLVELPANGTITGDNARWTYQPHPNFHGTDRFTFKAGDGLVECAPAAVSLTVTAENDSPDAAPQSATLNEDAYADLVLGGSDPDGDALTFRVVAAPAHGTLSGTPPNVRYTPTHDYHGADTFSFIVGDGTSLSAPAIVNLAITPVNDPPVGTGQSLTLDEDRQAATVLSGTDVDSDPLTYRVTRAPANGTLIGVAPALTFVPFPNFNGTDSFEFEVSDGSAIATAVVSLAVTALNDAPVALEQSLFLAEDTSLPILLAGSDIEGSVLTFRVSSEPSHGSLSGESPNLVYTPASNFFGADSFTVSAHDGESESLPVTISLAVTPVNDPPVAHALYLQAVEGQDLPILLTAEDVDGDPLVFTITSRPTMGSLSGTAPGLVYEAPIGISATEHFEFSVSDGTLRSPATPAQIAILRRVEAGPNQFVRSTAEPVALQGIARDNGLPAEISWRKLAGPGAVALADATNPTTTATFTSNGVYLLELTATDSARVARDTVEVRVGALCNEEAPDGMVAWWQASGDSLDYISGTTASLQNGVAFDIGKVGAAFRFDGVDDRVLVPASTALDVGQANGFTIEFWMNSTDVARAARLLAWHSGGGSRSPSTNWGVNIFQSGGNLNAQLYDLAGNPRDLIAFGALVNNAWTHVAVTYDRTSGQGRIYLNGTLRVSTQIGIYTPRTGYDLYLGHVPVETTWYRGLLDELSIYDRALDPQAIHHIYEAGEVGKCRANGNQAPVVHAGSDVVLRDTSSAALLAGEVSDSTLPGGSLRIQWSVLSGPGAVMFAEPNAPATTATFSLPGIYILRLNADDAEFSIDDFVEIRVAQLCTVAEIPSLVAWWPLSGDAADAVSGRESQLAGGPSFDSGRVSTALRFDGTNDVVVTPAHPTLDLGSGAGFTVEFWMNSADVGRQARLVSWHSGLALGSTNSGLNIYQYSGHLYAQFTDFSNNPREITLFGCMTNNTWAHVAVTYDRTSGHARIFLNGALRLTANLGNITPRTIYHVYLGNQPFDVGFYRGLLDEVSFYSRALDVEEVQQIYASGSVGKCSLNNLGPLVNAGQDVELGSSTDVAVLNGQVVDDGLPPGLPLHVVWTQLHGPGLTTFSDALSAATTASFSAPGIYVLQLTADDGAVVRYDRVEVRVAHVCTPSPADLVAWWPANGTAEEVATGRPGRLAGGTTFAGGKVSTALSFDGLNDAVHIPAAPALDVGAGSGFTIEFWMNSADVTRTARLLGWHTGAPGSTTNFGVNVYQYSGHLYAQVYDQTGNPHELVAFLSMTNNVWAHVALSYDRALGQGRIYVNGFLRATASVGSYRAQTTYGLFFGNLPHENHFYRGLLDEVAIYNRALANSEIQSIYDAGSGGRCRATPVLLASRESNELQFAPTVTVNELGLRTRMVDRSGTTEYYYDAGQRLTSVTKAWNAVAGQSAFVARLEYAYDEFGRLSEVRSSNANGTQIQYRYEGTSDFLTEVFDPHSGPTRYALDDQGRLVCTYPNGTTAHATLSAEESVSDSDLLDGDGNLALRVTEMSVTYFLVDPLSPAGGPRVVEELTADSSVAEPVVTRVYTYGHHLISVEEFVNGLWELRFSP